MGVNISSELITFVAVIIAGIISGIIYDTFFVISKANKGKTIGFYDLIFTILLLGIVLSVFYFFNSYELRWYMFIGLILGLIFYYLLLSKVYIFVFGKLLDILFKIFNFIFKILLTPTRFLYKILLVYIFNPIKNKFVVFVQKNKYLRGKLNEKYKKKIKKNLSENFMGDFIRNSFIFAHTRSNAATSDNNK